MYGTIARLRVKPGGVQALREMAEERGAGELPEGAVAEYVYQMDDDPRELFLVVIFEDKDSYVANARSPETHQRFLKWREWLTADPEWHDGEIVHAMDV